MPLSTIGMVGYVGNMVYTVPPLLGEQVVYGQSVRPGSNIESPRVTNCLT